MNSKYIVICVPIRERNKSTEMYIRCLYVYRRPYEYILYETRGSMFLNRVYPTEMTCVCAQKLRV